MGKEIEVRLLLLGSRVEDILGASPQCRIKQGYIHRDKDKVVRVRRRRSLMNVGMPNEKSFYQLTVKENVLVQNDCVNCDEYEEDISEDFFDLIIDSESVRKNGVILKTRYTFRDDNDVLWEIDSFANEELRGLVIAECELSSSDLASNLLIPKEFGSTLSIAHIEEFSNAGLAKRVAENFTDQDN